MLRLVPGQKIQAILYDGRIELIPFRTPQEMRGFLSGINTEIKRESERVWMA